MGAIFHTYNPNKSHGGQESWQLPLSGLAEASPGHLAALHYVNTHDQLSASNLLFRKKIPGQEDYNQMETPLKMAADIELADGTQIWFNQGNNRSTVVKAGLITMTNGSKSLSLQPGQLQVNPINRYDTAISTSGTLHAEGDIHAGDELVAKNSLTIGSMTLNSSSLKFNGKDVRDIKLYKVYDMYDNNNSVQPVVDKHCAQYPQQLFMIRDNGYARHLMMCMPSGNGGYTNWMLATGYYKWSQNDLHSVKPYGTGVP